MEDLDREFADALITLQIGRIMRDRSSVFDVYDDESFRRHFRLTRRTFYILCTWIEEKRPNSTEAWNNPLTTAQRLASLVLSIGTPQYQQSTADILKVSQPSVSRAVAELSDMFAAYSHEFIYFPDAAEGRVISHRIFIRSGIPGVVGSIDGTHVPILAPGTQEDQYLNRKGWHSINAGAIVDDKLRFRWASSKYPGRSHDSLVFRESQIYRDLLSGAVTGVILGDSAYRVEKFLYKPVLGAARSVKEKRFTDALCSVRVDAEHGFGVLKKQFNALHSELRYAPQRAAKLITTAICLRNVCIDQNDPQDYEDQDGADPPPQPDEDDSDDSRNDTGRAYMDRIIRDYF